MGTGSEGVLLRIELGLSRPSRAEVEERVAAMVEQLRPEAIVTGMRYVEDAVEVAIVSYQRYRQAQLLGPEAVRRLTPWEEEEADASLRM